jgi:hypothetical protein
MRKNAGDRIGLIAESFARLAGKPISASKYPLEQAMWATNRAIVAHGTQPDPLFFYGNLSALKLFAIDAADFIGMPSRLTTEPALHEERAQMFERLDQRGIIHDYSGVRVTSTGRRFEIFATDVWNLVDAHGVRHGQAARISGYCYLD